MLRWFSFVPQHKQSNRHGWRQRGLLVGTTPLLRVKGRVRCLFCNFGYVIKLTLLLSVHSLKLAVLIWFRMFDSSDI